MGLLKAHRSIDCSPGRELFPATGLSTGACKEGDAERGGHDDLGQILPLVALLVAMALGLAVGRPDRPDRRDGPTGRRAGSGPAGSHRRTHLGRRPGQRVEQGP